MVLAALQAGVDVQAQGRGRAAGASPASQRPPAPAEPQTYPAEQIDAGRKLFAAQCGFCHGRDAAGGTGGSDLTRSTLVAEDVRGNRIAPVVRAGRADKGMPAFPLSDPDMNAIVAFVHDQQAHAATLLGGRRSVDAADLSTGNAAAGRQFFERRCATCHTGDRDLKGVASRLQGLQLLQRMLYPGSTGRVAPPTVTVVERSGQSVTGPLAYRDEFTIAITDPAGWHRSWSLRQVTVSVNNPLQGHIDLLPQYTDKDMHDVLAYLQTLK